MPWTISDSGSGLAFHFGFWIQFWFRFRFGFVAIATWSATEARHNWPKLNRDYSIPKFPKKKYKENEAFICFLLCWRFLCDLSRVFDITSLCLHCSAKEDAAKTMWERRKIEIKLGQKIQEIIEIKIEINKQGWGMQIPLDMYYD